MYKRVSLHCIQDVRCLRDITLLWTDNTLKLYTTGGRSHNETPDQQTPPPHPVEKKSKTSATFLFVFIGKLFCQHEFGALIVCFGGGESFCSVKTVSTERPLEVFGYCFQVGHSSQPSGVVWPWAFCGDETHRADISQGQNLLCT